MKENELYKYRNDCEKQDRKLDIHYVAMSSQEFSNLEIWPNKREEEEKRLTSGISEKREWKFEADFRFEEGISISNQVYCEMRYKKKRNIAYRIWD